LLMSEPKITLQTIREMIEARPTTPEFDLALLEFLDLSDSEQKAMIFKELVNIGSQINCIVSRLKQ